MNSVSLLAAVAASAALATGAHAAAFINGGFEAGIDPGVFTTLSAGDSSSITGWTVGGGGVDYIGTYWVPSEGSRSVDLSALSAGSLSQTFDTVANKTYKVTFDLAGNPAGGSAFKFMQVSAGMNSTVYAFDTTGHSLSSMGWFPEYFTFTATGASSTLTFASLENSPYGPAIDNVTVSSVPEPAAWALMLVGIAGLGGALRASRRREAALA